MFSSSSYYHNPLAILYFKRQRRNTAISWSKAIKEYKSLPDNEKLKYILLSLEFCEANSLRGTKALDYISKKELLIYFRLHKDIVLPPKRPYLFNFQEDEDEDEDDENVFVSRYKKLALKKKFINSDMDNIKKTFLKFCSVWEEFDTKIKVFKETHSPVLGDAVRKAFKLEQKRRVKSRKRPTLAFTEVVTPHPYAPFPDQPKRLPFTFYQFYCLFLHDVSYEKREYYTEWLPKYRELIPPLADSVEEMVTGFKEKYQRLVLKYVKDLPIDRQRLFLGFHRRAIYSRMKEDIFEPLYPVDKFPVFSRRLIGRVEKETNKKLEETNDLKLEVPKDFDMLRAVRDSMAQLNDMGYDLGSSDSESE